MRSGIRETGRGKGEMGDAGGEKEETGNAPRF